MTVEVRTERLRLETRGRNQIIDLSADISDTVRKSGLSEGQATVFAIGSTAGITVIEYEPGLVETDLPALFERLAPYGADYAHHATWGDDNGAAHLRASLLGGSYVVPFQNAMLILGQWQQVVYVDFDTRPRRREIVVQLLGR